MYLLEMPMDDDRTERVSASLEALFDTCRKETDAYLSYVRLSDGTISPGCVDTFMKLVRMNTQLAATIARLDGVKNRNLKAQ
jgi:hypothetical protein